MTTEKSILLINNTVNGEFNPDNAEPEENETSIVTVEEEEKKADPTARIGLFAMDSFGFRRLQINWLSDKIIHTNRLAFSRQRTRDRWWHVRCSRPPWTIRLLKGVIKWRARELVIKSFDSPVLVGKCIRARRAYNKVTLRVYLTSLAEEVAQSR